jgi:uncharacterized lipoprotein YmbA
MISRIRIILWCLMMPIGFVQLVSCSGRQTAGKSLYALDPGGPTTAPQPESSSSGRSSSGSTGHSREQVVQVRRVNIAAPFNGPSLIYRTPDGTYVEDFYNQWVAPPEELFSGEMVNWLSASGRFDTVVDGRSAASHRFALETSITSLYGDFQDESHPKVVLNARIYLIDDAVGSRSVTYQNHYELSAPMERPSPEEFVRGCGRAYRQLLESATQDLSAFCKTVVASNRR